MRGNSRAPIAALLLAAASAAPGAAQASFSRPLSQIEVQADRQEELDNPVEEEARYSGRRRPWSLSPWVPLEWQSNLAASRRALRSGLAFEPEATIGRTWSIGPAQLLAEATAHVSTIPSQGGLDSSGWWLTAEAVLGDPRAGFAPYALYEPRSQHDGLFGDHAVTFHSFTAGARRRWGAANLNLYLRRRNATIDRLDRTLVGAQLSRTWRFADGQRFNLRTDAEYRWYDAERQVRRRDLFLRARSRYFIPLSSSVDLVLAADIQRNRSTIRESVRTSVFIGPALSAGFAL